jgi:hypothetical protein
MDANAPDPGPDPRIQVDKVHGLCLLYFTPVPYKIEFKRVKTEAELLSWAVHLSEKIWMDCSRLHDVIEALADANGLNCRVPC